jgi:phosphoesterase RecJ-like protein
VEKIIRKSSKKTIYFDHHQNPDDFTDLQIINTEKVAVGEMVFDFLTETQFAPISKQMANAIYTAILSDSGYFRYERTTTHTYNIAGKLLELGVNPKWIFEMLYERNSLTRTKLVGNALISTELHGDGKICSITIRNDILMKLNASDSDVEGITSYSLSIKDVKIGLVFVESENKIKASFRSRGRIPVNKLASEFGGGGHINAAGIQLENINFEEIRNIIINRAIEYLDIEEEK